MKLADVSEDSATSIFRIENKAIMKQVTSGGKKIENLT
jgi:hypothetical protein